VYAVVDVVTCVMRARCLGVLGLCVRGCMRLTYLGGIYFRLCGTT